MVHVSLVSCTSPYMLLSLSSSVSMLVSSSLFLFGLYPLPSLTLCGTYLTYPLPLRSDTTLKANDLLTLHYSTILVLCCLVLSTQVSFSLLISSVVYMTLDSSRPVFLFLSVGHIPHVPFHYSPLPLLCRTFSSSHYAMGLMVRNTCSHVHACTEDIYVMPYGLP